MPDPVQRQNALDVLADVVKRETEFRKLTVIAVKAARRRGATWDEIGALMGLSKATVHARYAETTAMVKRGSKGRSRSASWPPATRTAPSRVVVETDPTGE